MSVDSKIRQAAGKVPVHLRLVPTREEREAQEAHARLLAEQLFTFGKQVRDFADRYPANFRDCRDANGKALFRRFMDQLGALARQFEKLAAMAYDTPSLPVNRERIEAEVELVREKMINLSLGA